MKKLIIGLLLFVLAGSTISSAEETIRTISVTGEAEVEKEPDTAVINCSINLRDFTVKLIRDKANEHLSKILTALEAKGIEKDNIANYDINIERSWNREFEKYDGFEISQKYTITLSDLEKLKMVVDTLLENGINDVDNIELTYSGEDKVKKEVLAQAANNARAKAELLADTLGGELGAVIRVTEWGAGYYNYDDFGDYGGDDFGGDDFGGGESDRNYSFGKVSISAKVTATFELK